MRGHISLHNSTVGLVQFGRAERSAPCGSIPLGPQEACPLLRLNVRVMLLPVESLHDGEVATRHLEATLFGDPHLAKRAPPGEVHVFSPHGTPLMLRASGSQACTPMMVPQMAVPVVPSLDLTIMSFLVRAQPALESKTILHVWGRPVTGRFARAATCCSLFSMEGLRPDRGRSNRWGRGRSIGADFVVRAWERPHSKLGRGCIRGSSPSPTALRGAASAAGSKVHSLSRAHLKEWHPGKASPSFGNTKSMWPGVYHRKMALLFVGKSSLQNCHLEG